MSAADPAIVLGDLLGQEDLALELLSGGEDALRRPIAGAHAVELESPMRFLAKDWILLSAGPRLRGHRQAQRELVAELDEAGATALGFGIEPVFDQVPRTLLAEARARSFPVFAVPPKTPFRDVVSAVNRCLLSDELVNYQRLTFDAAVPDGRSERGRAGACGDLAAGEAGRRPHPRLRPGREAADGHGGGAGARAVEPGRRRRRRSYRSSTRTARNGRDTPISVTTPGSDRRGSSSRAGGGGSSTS